MAIVGRVKYTRARARNFDAPFASRLLDISRVCILPAPQSPSPKLETTRSLYYRLRFGKTLILTNVGNQKLAGAF